MKAGGLPDSDTVKKVNARSVFDQSKLSILGRCDELATTLTAAPLVRDDCPPPGRTQSRPARPRQVRSRAVRSNGRVENAPSHRQRKRAHEPRSASSIPQGSPSRRAIPTWSSDRRPARTVYIAGQLGAGPTARWSVARDFRAQAVQVFENLKAALAAVGGGFEDVVKLNNYLVDIAHLPILREVRAAICRWTDTPAEHDAGRSPSFAREGALLEIEAIAVLPARPRQTRARRGRKKSPRAAQKGRQAGKTKVSSAKHGSSTSAGPEHVAEEARHLDAALVRDRIDHEIRRIADIGQRAHEHRAHRDRRERRRERPHQLPAHRRRRVRRTPDRSAHCRGRPRACRSARNRRSRAACRRVRSPIASSQAKRAVLAGIAASPAPE